jgi:hypothetical protein
LISIVGVRSLGTSLQLTRLALAGIVYYLHGFSQIWIDWIECLRGDGPVQMVSRWCKAGMEISVLLPDLRLQTLEGFFD